MANADNNGFTSDILGKMISTVADIATTVETVIPSIRGPNSTLTSAEITSRYNSLDSIFRAAQKNMGDAPVELSTAERNLYEFNNGKTGGAQIYTDLIIARFATTAQEFRTNSIEMQQQFMADMAQALKQYQAEVIFSEQSTKLLKTRQTEHTDLIKNINYYQKIVQTSERKVVYENKNMESLYTYRRLMIFIYYAAVIGFIIFGNFIPDQLYLKYSVWLILVIVAIIPIILNIVIKWLFLFYDTLSYWFGNLPHKDVYLHFGSPADEPPPLSPVNSVNTLIDSLGSATPATLLASLSSFR